MKKTTKHKHVKNPSRQYMSQKRRRENGMCIVCARPQAEGSNFFCKPHWTKAKKNNLDRYRKANGIPLNRPVRKYNKREKVSV